VHLLGSLFVLFGAADALGAWTANGARLDLKDEGGKVVGRLAAPGGPCAAPVGSELLSGVLIDDSLSAQVRLCLIAQPCGDGPETALAVLLVTRTLTGGVHTKAECAKDVHALVLRRPGPAEAMRAPPPKERLSNTPPPVTQIVSAEKIPATQIGQIPGRPVGEAEHAKGYDPRDARNTQKNATDKLLLEGAAYLQEGRFERAQKSFRDALALDPRRAEAYNGVGVTYYARADLDEAMAWYKRALEADPRFGDAFYNLACVYALQGKRELAFRYLRMAVLNHYASREQAEQDSDLESLRGDPQWRDILDQMKR